MSRRDQTPTCSYGHVRLANSDFVGLQLDIKLNHIITPCNTAPSLCFTIELEGSQIILYFHQFL